MGFIIPTTFTAIDKFVRPVGRMVSAMNKFVGVSESGIARQERLFHRLTPIFSEATSQLWEMGKAAAIVGGALAAAGFSGAQIMQYEDNLASFRTIVSDLTDKDFEEFRKEIFKVGADTKRSSVVVAEAFEKVAGLNADFAKTAEGLGQVSTAAITLSKASKEELAPSAENLVGIMNQFGFGAEQASRTINVLAAGQAVGAASISETAESLQVFGAVAKSSNTTVEQSVALIEVLAAKQIKGSEAGTALRGSFVRLQKAQMGYKSGQFQINDALADAKKRMDALHSSAQKDAFLIKLFGMENLAAGKILLDSIPKIKEFTDSVSGTSEAQKAAAINSNTLSNRVEELKAKWVNFITGSNDTTKALGFVKNAIMFVTDNMSTLVSVGITVISFFALWKAWIVASKVALIAYNVVLGLSTAMQERSAFYVMGNTVAYGAYRTAVVIATVATKLWAIAMNIGLWPILLIIAAIGILIAIIYSVVKHIKGWGEQWDEITRWMGQVWDVVSAALKLNWLLLKEAFLTMVDAIVLAWKWGQNLIGNISDEQFAKDKARIEQEKKIRIQAIKETAIEGIKAAKAIEAPAWKLKWKTDEDIKAEEAEQNSSTPAINSKSIQTQLQMQGSQPNQATRDRLEISVKTDANTKADVSKNPSGIPIKMAPSTVGWQNTGRR